MTIIQSGQSFTLPALCGMCYRPEMQNLMPITKWNEDNEIKHEILGCHPVFNVIKLKVNAGNSVFSTHNPLNF